jgi:hypothetical protein
MERSSKHVNPTDTSLRAALPLVLSEVCVIYFNERMGDTLPFLEKKKKNLII